MNGNSDDNTHGRDDRALCRVGAGASFLVVSFTVACSKARI